MPQTKPHIVILNAALAGPAGNTAVVLEKMRLILRRRARVSTVALDAATSFADLHGTLTQADAYVFGTGTHWDSWSSSLQRFLEDATPAEGSAIWLGKPAACIVTEHSVGGKGVLSRLQGVLNTLGCEIPPMSGLVLSRAGQIARQHAPDQADDFWCTDDLVVVAHNLIAAASGKRDWKTWPVDRTDFAARWLEL